MSKVKVGIIGCGNISGIYLENLTKMFFNVELVAVADKAHEKAVSVSKEYGINALTVSELLADPLIEIVVNLTTPQSHFEINMAALTAGKHVYCEKPLAITREDGLKTVAFAQEKGLLVGCAPDTFLGGGIQTCIKLIDDGWIGQPVAATAFMMSRGHESWHPDPEFYYQTGGGPMFDMGPYYLTALIAMLGGVKRVCGSTGISFPKRRITSAPKYGKIMDVEVPTHVAGVMDFRSGVIGTIITTFDVVDAQLPRIEIYGSEGTLSVPDPNTFGGPVKIRRGNTDQWMDIPLSHGLAENSRGAGVSDMAHAIRNHRQNRAGGDVAFHVLDIMHGFHDAAASGKYYETINPCERPTPLPLSMSNHEVT